MHGNRTEIQACAAGIRISTRDQPVPRFLLGWQEEGSRWPAHTIHNAQYEYLVCKHTTHRKAL